MEVKVYNRGNLSFETEDVNKFVIFLYNTVLGRILLKLIFTKKWFTKLNSCFIKSRVSSLYINRFIKKNNIDMSRVEEKKYISFDDFFTRRLVDEAIKMDEVNNLLSVSDGKLMVYDIDDNLSIHIKNSIYTISELLKDDDIASWYKGGVCLVYRLTKDDYHHYYYFDDGDIIYNKKIKGSLHTVMPIAHKKYKVYTENTREYDVINTKNYGKIVYMEVGALMISKINNDSGVSFKRGDHRGYFSFGASTIIVLFKKDMVKIDSDILSLNREGYEVKVGCLEKIGQCK